MTRNIEIKVQRWVKWFLPFYLLTFLPLSLLSQTLTASAPSQVAVGEQFRLTYTINTQNVSEFRAGNIPEELEAHLLGLLLFLDGRRLRLGLVGLGLEEATLLLFGTLGGLGRPLSSDCVALFAVATICLGGSCLSSLRF